jgi:hypothetical protein
MQFGVPLYGASMQGQLKYVSSNEKGCGSFQDEFKSVGGESFIALVVRGGKPSIATPPPPPSPPLHAFLSTGF